MTEQKHLALTQRIENWSYVFPRLNTLLSRISTLSGSRITFEFLSQVNQIRQQPHLKAGSRGKPSPTSLCCFGIINVESNYHQDEGLEINAEGKMSRPEAEKKNWNFKVQNSFLKANLFFHRIHKMYYFLIPTQFTPDYTYDPSFHGIFKWMYTLGENIFYVYVGL